MAQVGGRSRRDSDSRGRLRQKTVLRKSRKRPAFSLFRTRLRRAFYAVGLCLVLAALGHVSYGFFVEAPYFRVNRLEIEGVSPTITREIEGLVATVMPESRNMLGLDANRLTTVLRGHPWIRTVKVQKIYPDTLLIKATEREPMAVVSADSFYLADRDGYVMERLKPSALRRYEFPFITGVSPDEIEVGLRIDNHMLVRALDLVRVLKVRNPDLYARFSEIHVSKGSFTSLESLTAQMIGGLEVRFGDKNPIDKLPSLEFFISMQQEQKSDPFALAYVDLRFENQIVFMDRPTAVAAASGMLEKLRSSEESEDEKSPKAGGGREKNRTRKPVSSDRSSGEDAGLRESDGAADARPEPDGATRPSAPPDVHPDPFASGEAGD